MSGSPYPFLPRSLARGEFLVWLRRIHAWLGLWGALLGAIYGFTGILLDHKLDYLPFAIDKWDESSIEVPAPQSPPTNLEAFGRWLRAEHRLGMREIHLEVKKEEISIDEDGNEEREPESWVATYATPPSNFKAIYVPGDKFATIERVDRGFIGSFMRLHMVIGVGPGWIVFADSIVGAFLLLALSGVLLWSKLDGPRLLALGLGTGGLLLGLGIFLKAMLVL